MANGATDGVFRGTGYCIGGYIALALTLQPEIYNLFENFCIIRKGKLPTKSNL